MAEFVRVRSVDAPGEYLISAVRAGKHPERYVIVGAEVVPPVVEDSEEPPEN